MSRKSPHSAALVSFIFCSMIVLPGAMASAQLLTPNPLKLQTESQVPRPLHQVQVPDAGKDLILLPANRLSSPLLPPISCCDSEGCSACQKTTSVAAEQESDRAATKSQSTGFVQNSYVALSSYRTCEELAGTLADCLSDSSIAPESRRRILESTMKLLVRNAELEAQAEVARINLKHEREMSAMRGDLTLLQGQLSTAGAVKNWMGPLYTNQNQTQQQINRLTTNLQLVNRTLKLLEDARDSNNRMQSNQPLPVSRLPNPSSSPRPERWSQLPSHTRPEPPKHSVSDDHLTQENPLANPITPSLTSRATTRRLPPPRLTPEEVRIEQLNGRIRQLQAELERKPETVRQAGWESNQLRPLAPVRNQ